MIEADPLDNSQPRRPAKSEAAFRTISEVSDDLEVPQHVLRFWESKFPQIKPLKRGGGRRYYRPEDVQLLRRIRDLLYKDGYTIRGVQKLLREHPKPAGPEPAAEPGLPLDVHSDPQPEPEPDAPPPPRDLLDFHEEAPPAEDDVHTMLAEMLDELMSLRVLLRRARKTLEGS